MVLQRPTLSISASGLQRGGPDEGKPARLQIRTEVQKREQHFILPPRGLTSNHVFKFCKLRIKVFNFEKFRLAFSNSIFSPRSDVFMSPTSVPENECFCTDEKLCSALGDGMFGISTCQFGAPIVLSWPHFLGANDTYRNAVEGEN